MALAAKNKAGSDYPGPLGVIRTPDILASFSLVGNILGILVAIYGVTLAWYRRWNPVLVAGVPSPLMKHGSLHVMFIFAIV